jgi:uncharacterized protein YbaR (Trm112 family)
MIDKELLSILCCPETKEDVFLASDSLVEKINNLISEKKIKNKAGDEVTEKIDSALLRADRKIAYPIREDIPIMLIEEGLVMDNVIDSGSSMDDLTKKI